jgi:hypothetical protein
MEWRNSTNSFTTLDCELTNSTRPINRLNVAFPAKPELYAWTTLKIHIPNTDDDNLIQYGDSGWFTCGGYPGSYGNELRDLRTFSNWGFDYLKYDNCASKF